MANQKKKAAAKKAAKTKSNASTAIQHEDAELLAASPGTVGRGLDPRARNAENKRKRRAPDPVANGDVKIGEISDIGDFDISRTEPVDDWHDVEESEGRTPESWPAEIPPPRRLGASLEPIGTDPSTWTYEPREYWEPERLQEAEYNVIRRISDAQFSELKRGIEHFGLLGGLDARAEDGLMIGGHQRRRAAMELIEKHRKNPEQLRAMNLPDGRIPVNPVRGISDSDAALLNVRLNNPAAQGKYDLPNLAQFLSEMDANGLDATLTGFSGDALEAILTFEAEPSAIREEPDDVDLEPKETSTTPKGAIFQLGRHRLICGSATDPDVWTSLLEGVRVDGVATDPPYGVDYVGKTADALTIENDQLSEALLESELIEPALTLAFFHSRPGAAWYVFAPGGPLFLVFARVLRGLGVWRETLSWCKDRFVLGRQDYHWRDEPMLAGERDDPDEQRKPIPARVKKEAEATRQPIVYGWKEGARHYFVQDRTQDTLWTVERPARSTDHPTMKPLELYRRMFRNSSTPGARWVDCFAGSGPSILAGEQTGRIVYAIENDPRYVDVIIRRWEKHTNQKAERVE